MESLLCPLLITERATNKLVVDEGSNDGCGKRLSFRLLCPSHHDRHESGNIYRFGRQVDESPRSENPGSRFGSPGEGQPVALDSIVFNDTFRTNL